MCWRPLLCLLAVSALALPAEEQERRIHRLIGGHLRIFHEDPQDADFLLTSASGSKDKKQKPDDEEKKTLSQQVADGKYGLIQKELFTKPSKRPGVISYENNPEVPTDNINNLGGLTKGDIWLAENHLLVLKGGAYPPHEDKKDNGGPLWPAIDDYKAPLRQVKIPAHPKVPPPFPVQLTEDGPLQILGTNDSRTINGSFDEAAYAVPPPDGYEPGTGPFFPLPPYPYPANATSGQAPFPIPAYPPGEYEPGSPFPPFLLNGTLPPFFASLPPGAAVLPPPSNQTEPFDEDDPSIYYPPPYSFYYPKDNSSVVPAGPLVPGIILPPPPNFFGPLEETTRRPTTTTKKPSRSRTKFTTTPLPQIRPTISPVPPTSVIDNKITKKPVRILPVHTPAEINNELKPIITTTPLSNIVTVLPVRHATRNRTYYTPRTQKPTTSKRPPSVTVLKPVKPSVYVYDNEVQGKPFGSYGPPSRVKTVISTTQVPLKLYYSTTNDIETNSITQPPEKFHIGITNSRKPKTTTKSPAQYYYYEEQQPNDISTTKPTYFDIPKEYYVAEKPSNAQKQQTQRPQFIYVTSRPFNNRRPQYRFIQQTPKTDSFSLHIARLQNEIQQYYTTPKPLYRPVLNSPKPVYQFSFEAANYQPRQNIYQQNNYQPKPHVEDSQDKFRPLPRYSVQVQPAIEIIPTEAPDYKNTPQPVYYRQEYQSSTERPAPSQYYSTPRPDYEYEDVDVGQKNKFANARPSTPPARPLSQYSFEATPNPIYQGYYTKPDEGYFDENTKQYFTTFGQKIPSGTTPLPQASQSQAVPSKSTYRGRKPDQYRQRPVSLEGDTAVNYLPPRPTINPDAEFVPINPNQQRVNYPQVVKYASRPAQYAQKSKQNEGAEIIKAVPVEVPTGEGQPGSFISYQLPGDDGAHFYFLTPQLAQRRDQGAGYYFSQANVPRVRRNGRGQKR